MSEPRQRPPRPAEAAILAATEQLLGERPFSALSVSDITELAGVSRTSFYAHFASRAAVLVACLSSVVGELRESVDALPFDALPFDARDDPAAAVRAGLERWVAAAAEHGALLRTVCEEWPHDADLRALWIELMTEFSDGLAQVIDRARMTGAARPGADAQALAACLIWGCERVLHVALVGGAPGLAAPANIAEPLAQMIVGGVSGGAWSVDG